MSSKARWIIFILSLLAGLLAVYLAQPKPVQAWESLPEFQSLTEDEQAIFEGPSRIAPRYTSDTLAYLKPEAWEYSWLTHDKVLDLSIGSVSASHFLMGNRLKLRAPLTEHFEFRFTYFDESGLERESRHHVMELVVWPWRFLGVSFYGEPELYKRNDDTGIALLLRPTPRHEIRLFNTFVDVTRLKRNDRDDTYLEPELPYARGLVGRLWSNPEGDRPGEFLEYALRYETPTRWLFPSENYIYSYRKSFGSLYFAKSITPAVFVSGRFQADRKFESRTNSSDWRTDRVFTLLRGILPKFGPKQDWELTLGAQHAYRSWTVNGETGYYRDILPHFWLSFPAFGVGEGQDRWSIGMDSTYHEASGPEAIFNRDERPGLGGSAWYGRINLAYEFKFERRASLKLMATADLTEFGGSKSWGGGNGQFQIKF